MFQVVYIDEILFAGDMNELRKKWSWIMSLYVSLFRGLSASNPPPNPMLSPIPEQTNSDHVGTPRGPDSSIVKLIRGPVSLHAWPQGYFLFCSQASLAFGSIHLAGCSQGLASISRSRCNLKTGLEGCESSVTNC